MIYIRMFFVIYDTFPFVIWQGKCTYVRSPDRRRSGDSVGLKARMASYPLKPLTLPSILEVPGERGYGHLQDITIKSEADPYTGPVHHPDPWLHQRSDWKQHSSHHTPLCHLRPIPFPNGSGNVHFTAKVRECGRRRDLQDRPPGDQCGAGCHATFMAASTAHLLHPLLIRGTRRMLLVVGSFNNDA